MIRRLSEAGFDLPDSITMIGPMSSGLSTEHHFLARASGYVAGHVAGCGAARADADHARELGRRAGGG